jgi:hypothetical protein
MFFPFQLRKQHPAVRARQRPHGYKVMGIAKSSTLAPPGASSHRSLFHVEQF